MTSITDSLRKVETPAVEVSDKTDSAPMTGRPRRWLRTGRTVAGMCVVGFGVTAWLASVGGRIAEVETPADEVDDTTPTAPAPVSGRPRRWRQVAAIVVAIGVVGCGATVWVASHRSGQSPPPPTTAQAAVVPPATGREDFTTYTDPAKHYRISHPSEWQRTTDAEGGLVLQVGGQNAVSVREFPLAAAVNTQNVADMRAVTDAILSAPNAQLTILESQLVRVGPLTGLYYLYTFPSGGERGVHAHYFLFSGKRMFTLVFQALPVTDFEPLAKTFDAVAETFTATGGTP